MVTQEDCILESAQNDDSLMDTIGSQINKKSDERMESKTSKPTEAISASIKKAIPDSVKFVLPESLDPDPYPYQAKRCQI